MGSKAKTVSRSGPGKPAIVENRAGSLWATREQEIRIRAYSTLVSRYKQAGLVIFGKTNSPELGLTTTTEQRHVFASD